MITKVPVVFSIISPADSRAQVQRLGRTSPAGDIHIAQFETLIKDKEGIGMREMVTRQAC